MKSKPIDTLIEYLKPDTKNIAELLDQETLDKIAEEVILGYHIDDESRQDWLNINKKAMEMVSGKELINNTEKDFPIPNAAKVIYPLISNSIIQLASRMIMHLVRNGRVAECVVLGKDEQRVIPNPNYQPPQQPTQQGQPVQSLNQGNQQQMPATQAGNGVQQGGRSASNPYMLEWKKAAKAKRVSDFLSYELLIDSDSWLEDEHRLCHIVAGWGVGFKYVYYDPTTKKNCSELIPPEDIIINNNHYGPLNKAPRITIRQYLTQNDIISKIRTGYFLDVDFNEIESNKSDNTARENNSQEINPVVEVLKQICWYDLDGDDYKEPYCVYVALNSKKLLGIEPAFKFKNISIDPVSGTILSIKPTINIVDRHLISNPEGKYYSYGLNHLLFHQNKSITTVLRQLLDAGTLSNIRGSTGFVSKSLKTRERTLRISMGQFYPVDVPQGTRIEDHFMQMPTSEPSQVLLALLQLLIDTAKESGFITDLLTGQTEMQNVPATTVLATIEQGTRSFKPVVQKQHRSQKQEFKIWFDLYSEFLDEERYIRFQDESFVVVKDDFDESLDIVPVADPTMSSEAHKYARLQAMAQFMQNIPGSTNVQEGALRFYTDLQFPNPEALVAPPQQPAPDPKLLEVQLKTQLAPMEQKLNEMELMIKDKKISVENRKVDIKAAEAGIKLHDSKLNTASTIVKNHKDMIDALNDQNITDIERYNAETERERVKLLARQSRGENNPKNNS